jgi:hypothetical protein
VLKKVGMEPKLTAGRAALLVSGPSEKTATYAFLGLFAILLAFVTGRHEMYVDEGQPWLIARDSRNLLKMFQHLRYEGHPGLWYVLLYLPAHLSGSVIWIQVINFTLSVVMACLVLSERRIPIALGVGVSRNRSEIVRSLLLFWAWKSERIKLSA